MSHTAEAVSSTTSRVTCEFVGYQVTMATANLDAGIRCLSCGDRVNIVRYCATCGEREGSDYAKRCCIVDNMLEETYGSDE